MAPGLGRRNHLYVRLHLTQQHAPWHAGSCSPPAPGFQPAMLFCTGQSFRSAMLFCAACWEIVPQPSAACIVLLRPLLHLLFCLRDFYLLTYSFWTTLVPPLGLLPRPPLCPRVLLLSSTPSRMSLLSPFSPNDICTHLTSPPEVLFVCLSLLLPL